MSSGDIIPDGEILYRFINPSALPDDQQEIPPGIFQDKELSCDWKKYRENPLTSFHIDEGKSIILEIHVNDEIRNPRNPKREGDIVPAWKQEIIHDPQSSLDDPTHGENIAHSLIKGKKKAAVTSALIKNSNIYLK